uniref:RDD domain-containing protein n=1 Tax=viral metagenome TaxID=1070528 RepID=A0A6C0KTD3_9ZZZZ
MNLCQYKDLLGKPNEGIRKYRIFDIAIFDTVFVIIFAYFISRFLNWSFFFTAVLIFISGIIAHRLFCVRTGLDKKLFP